MRGADERAELTLTDVQILPRSPANEPSHNGCPNKHVIDEWSEFLGGYPVAIVDNVGKARVQLLTMLSPASGTPVLLPPNSTHRLVESVKRSGSRPVFGELDESLSLANADRVRLAWSQPIAGLPSSVDVDADFLVIDHSDSLPNALAFTGKNSLPVDIVIFGLHLSSDPTTAGALVVFGNAEIYRQWQATSGEPSSHLCQLAERQLARINQLSMEQRAALDFVVRGLEAAAGLSILPAQESLALSQGVAVRIPDGGHPATFWTYAQSENTPVEWLPLLRPIHHAAIACQNAAIDKLQHWLFVPTGPNNTVEQYKQSVLGIVKAAEYTGLRWHEDPGRAREYAALLTKMYGDDHDAYRPTFQIEATIPARVSLDALQVVGPTCPL